MACEKYIDRSNEYAIWISDDNSLILASFEKQVGDSNGKTYVRTVKFPLRSRLSVKVKNQLMTRFASFGEDPSGVPASEKYAVAGPSRPRPGPPNPKKLPQI